MMTNDGKKERHRRANNAFFRIKKTQKLCFLFLFFFLLIETKGGFYLRQVFRVAPTEENQER